MSFDFDHAHKRKEQIAKSISGSFNIDNLEKSEVRQDTVIGTPFDNQSRIAMNISQSYSNAPEISKAEEDELEKGGKKAYIGEIRVHGNREYIRTANGWKFHGKGTGKKAAEHKAAAASHTKEATSAAKKSTKGGSDPGRSKEGNEYDDEGKPVGGMKEKKDLIAYIASKVNYNKEYDQSIPEYEIMNAIKEFKEKYNSNVVELLGGQPIMMMSSIRKAIHKQYNDSGEDKKKSGRKEAAPEGTIREFGGRSYIKKDGKWKYHPKGASKSTEESGSRDKINKEFDALVAKTSDPEQKKKLEEKRKEALETSAKSYKDSKPASGKHISDMSATEKKKLADKLGVDTKGKTVKQVDKALSDAMVDKQMSDWKASKKPGKSKESEKAPKNISLQDLRESKNGTVYYKGERTRSVFPSYGYWHINFPEGSKMKDFQIKGGNNVNLKDFKINK